MEIAWSRPRPTKNTSFAEMYLFAKCWILPLLLKSISICSGSFRKSLRYELTSWLVISPRTCANLMASRYSAISCALYALVVATAISGPAQVYMTLSASRAIELPTTLTMPRVLTPLSLASRSAARESAVSPDWLMMMTRSFCAKMGLR